MKRIKLTVAYDGTHYNGWQVQPNGVTIEGMLNKAIAELTNETVAVIGASRTDSGVHALGNVAVFDTNTRIPPEKLCYALNQRLPADIVVQHSCEVPLHFHPRRCESRKTYVYKILNRAFPLPLSRYDCYFTYRKLDVEKMRQAAAYLVGTHDFKSFCSVHSQAETSDRQRLFIQYGAHSCRDAIAGRHGGTQPTADAGDLKSKRPQRRWCNGSGTWAYDDRDYL